MLCLFFIFFFFFNDPATTEIYTLSLHDALPIFLRNVDLAGIQDERARECIRLLLNLIESLTADLRKRSEEHTSELQSRRDLVCRLLLEKKKKNNTSIWKERVWLRSNNHFLHITY